MANKQKTERAARNDLIRLCCYVALALGGLLIFINNLLPLCGVTVSGTVFKILALIRDVALLIGISFGAYSFARSHGKVLTIIFWIVFVIYVVGIVLGVV